MGNELPPLTEDHAAGRRVAAALAANREEAALHLLNSVADWPRWRADIAAAAAAAANGSPRFLEPLLVFVDYLGRYFSTADEVWKRLYVGEKLRMLHEPGVDDQTDQCRRQQLAADDQRGLRTVFRRKLLPGDFAEFQRGLAEITSILSGRPRCWVRVLLIGDFLQLDVLALLYGELREERIALDPTCIANTDPVELRSAIHRMAREVFDFIFYTPMSDLDSPPIARLHTWAGAWTTGRAAGELAESAAGQAMATVDLLRSLWACPIIVNNAAGVARHDDRLGQWLRSEFSQRACRQFGERVNRRLAECTRTNKNVSLFDEHALLAGQDPWELGRVLLASERKHPIVLGQRVAEGYRKLIVSRLAGFADSPQQIVGVEDRTVGAGQSVDPVAPPAARARAFG